MNCPPRVLAPLVFFLLAAPAADAQDLAQLCPNSKTDTGALVGTVSDLDAQMALPGATVRAAWQKDGTPGHAETETGLDGGFRMCYLPLGTELSVEPMLGSLAGQITMVSLAGPITRQDLGFSLTGGEEAQGGEGGKIWACIGPPDSQMRVRLGGLVRCDPQWPPLEQCPNESLGKVSASAGTRGRGAMREMIDSLVDQAKRLGANALVDVNRGRGSMDAMAVKIEGDPSGC